MPYRLLSAFAGLFEGKKYVHRSSNLGDHVASFLLDDVYRLDRSAKLKVAVDSQRTVLNVRNKTVGVAHRRGDGTFGAAVPNVKVILSPEHIVALGDVAQIEIGAEVKILAKAMIKQLDRVGRDMIDQVKEFKGSKGRPICVGVIGVNYAPLYRSFEGEREWLTDGAKYKHPSQEAAEAERRLVARVAPEFDELVVLRFRASNIEPFDFAWVDRAETERQYGAALLRIADAYQQRF